MIPPPVLLLVLWAELDRSLAEEPVFELRADIHHIAVAPGSVYISTAERLYQLDHDLTLVQSVAQRGILAAAERRENAHFRRVSETSAWNATFSINVLLPFVANGTLISCGVAENWFGYCELLDPKNISNVLRKENVQVGPNWRGGASVVFLVNVENETYILAAWQDHDETRRSSCQAESVRLHNTNDIQVGKLLSVGGQRGAPAITSGGRVEFVDGFQIDSVIYIFSNLPSSDKRNKVRLLWLEGANSKEAALKSLRGATLSIAAHGEAAGSGRLVASSVIPGGAPGVLWAGVFSVDGGEINTELILFDVSRDPAGDTQVNPDLCSAGKKRTTLAPKKVLFRKNYMTSVLAVRHKAWTVFFIGTGDGQLIKLAVDRNYRTTCPRVLYRADDDRRVLPKLHLDQVDLKHVYVAFRNQVRRVAVAECNTYANVPECWSAQDPHCVWCSSERRCTFEGDCRGSDWVSIPEDSQQKMVSYKVDEDRNQITLHIRTHLTVGPDRVSNFACHFSLNAGEFCLRDGPPPQFPKCTCVLANGRTPPGGLHVTVKIRVGRTELLEKLNISNCTDIRGSPTHVLCHQCIQAGCGWSENGCSWANQGQTNEIVCQMTESGSNFSRPEISSISPSVVSFHGRNGAVMTGRNLHRVTRVRLRTDASCTPQEYPVLSNMGLNLTFHIPSSDIKGVVQVCAVLPGGGCYGDAKITYQSSPSCTSIAPNSSWVSGRRTITLIGSHLEFVEGVMHRPGLQEVRPPRNSSYQNLTYDTPATEREGFFKSHVFVKIANDSLSCSLAITYYPDPEFTTFTSLRAGDHLRITIKKKADKLEMAPSELRVSGVHGGKDYPCIMEGKENSTETELFNCVIRMTPDAEFQHLKISYGNTTLTINLESSFPVFVVILIVVLLTLGIVVLLAVTYRHKQKQLTAEMKKTLDDLELNIRNELRQGFVDLQSDEADLMENIEPIPFLDYKHFAAKIFFPESESLMTSSVEDIGQVQVQLDECCQGLSRLIQDRFFLTSMVHTLEEQKSFTIKDKCMLASLLTVTLHGNLSYLTEVMEALLSDLMRQNSNAQHKLLLRRTQSVVEKLLTNWMSVCLYSFLRESVGQHLFLMVSALTKQTAKGPVDCVTKKALYTLSEDWLLWQAQDFSSLKLKVLFAGSDGEVSEPLEVNALSCDSIEQVKEKVLSTFKAKFGFPYNTSLRDLCIEYEKNGSFVPLEKVDASSKVIGEATMLNTLKHYMVPDGATIKVIPSKTPPLSPGGCLTDDEKLSEKYFHLIDPDVDADQRKNSERKFKLKEMHLIKLLSTKVAVHSFVEDLFKSILGMPHSKAPHAIKYFFDFLDTQADNMKITDPDVLHIWKTNSLPLRFWVNIIKNPQFVFDIEKTPNLDGCLSVIAQAFMDSFSLSGIQLGKHAPTNKLLYAKDIPKFKQEVKAYYKQIRGQPTITVSEFKDFLREESKKHESEFNEAVALRELYKFIDRYFTQIIERLDQNGAPAELKEQLRHVKHSFDELKSCSWN